MQTASHSLTRSDQRRNFFWGVVNGSLFSVAEVFLDSEMVLTWFLSQLGVANSVIGLVGPIRIGGWFLPQVFVSGYLQRQPYKMRFYRSMVVVRLVVLALLVLGMVRIPTGSPWMLRVFMFSLVLYSLAAGLAGIPFMDMVGKVVPSTRRGSFFGQRMFYGGILALGTSSLVGLVLGEPYGLRFPLNFALLFASALVLIGISAGAWCLVKEPPSDVDPTPVHWTEQVRRGAALLRQNPQYRTFVLTRLALMIAQLAAPFYIVYAKTMLGIPAHMVGVYLTARTAASIVFNPVWGRVSDHRGNRMLIRLTNAVALSMPLLALAVGLVGDVAPQTMGWLSSMYTVVFIASGVYGAGSAIGNMGYILDIAPPAQRPLYLGFTNTLFGIGIFTSSLGGLIVDWAGFTTLMILSACFYALALVLSLLMDEPRKA